MSASLVPAIKAAPEPALHSEALETRASELEAFETDQWAARAILKGEILTPWVVDTCVGLGMLAREAIRASYLVKTMDIYDWSQHPELSKEPPIKPDYVGDWLDRLQRPPVLPPKGEDWTALMNPPFDTAIDFIEQAMDLGARKIVCFQRYNFRESGKRIDFWEKKPPARTWICMERATCFRFDVPHQCPKPGICRNKSGKKRIDPYRCRTCMASTPTTHAFFVWERGHKGAEIVCNLTKAMANA